MASHWHPQNIHIGLKAQLVECGYVELEVVGSNPTLIIIILITMDIYIAPIHVNMLLGAQQLKENLLKSIQLKHPRENTVNM